MNLSGFLLASPTRSEITREMLLAIDGEPGKLAIKFVGPLFKLRQWEEFRFLSDQPLDEDDVRNHPDGPPYPHTMVSVRSGAKMLLLADRKKVAEYILRRVLNRKIFPNLRRVRVHTDPLIDSCQDTSSIYLITALHGSYSGSDRHISRISLYGDDITESSLYREQRHLFNFYSCGIRRRLRDNLLKVDLNDESEIALLGNDGFVSGQISDSEGAREVIFLINYIVRNRWVDSWVPDIAMD